MCIALVMCLFVASEGIRLTITKIAHVTEKDVRRTDRELPMFKADDSPMLSAMSDILTTYTIYNMDLGTLRLCVKYGELYIYT